MDTMITGRVRFSYVNFFQPRGEGLGAGKYGITLLIPKSDVTTRNAVDGMIAKCAQDNAATFGGKVPAMLKMPIHDGDGVRQSGEPYGEECKGHWVMAASSQHQQEAVDENVQPIINPAKLYSGCYGRAEIHFYAYNNSGNKGVACGLGPVQKLADGEPLAGSSASAVSVFGGTAAAAPAQQYAQPAQQYAQPAQQYAPAAPAYTPPAAPGAINPITGLPYAPLQGGVAGLPY